MSPLPHALTHWSIEQVATIATDGPDRLPVLTPADVVPIDPAHDFWDMWQIARADGSTVFVDGRSYWFFLGTPRFDDPESRHDAARIYLTSHGSDGWRLHDATFPDGLTPGSREWSGSAVLAEDGETLTMYFTAAGRRGGQHSFEQRLFETVGRFVVDSAGGRTEGWSTPVESVAADGRCYRIADEVEASASGIKGFRDPGFFHDPATGHDHLLFVGSAAWTDAPIDGLVGIASRTSADAPWQLGTPLVDAIGVNSELERPHIILRDGLYYLFWSTQAKRFAPGLPAPTGLYAMVSDSMAGPWRPVNGSGLVAGNPVAEPTQAYCWWVTGEGQVAAFVDYAGLNGADAAVDVALRRARFGGTAAPFFQLDFAGDRVTIRATG
ncbi:MULTISPECIES: glycoside hydrolase family 68 protein [unclassified Sphingomonas]|uniref:glycoside hydrolase family 68 protein n=1 Tax=unclassified Sphingomonas TaxID=196159 RepID=UPI0006F5E207|nr:MULTISPECIES: glycoside hydrolase family 68 protein [unclassified Sphingomonas]KQM57263.1 levansucrase [Sphingomonas sp. Leaf16]KQN10438.1 levansucrase [Sphingomonas sp. Leaf29]KQN18239.1 levansucrase [Sphingomonas sp. Leaf32]